MPDTLSTTLTARLREVLADRPATESELRALAEEAVAETAHPKIMRASRSPIDASWLDEQLRELERLVSAGDTLEVVGKLGEMVRFPRGERVGDAPPAGAAAEAESVTDPS